MAKLCAFRSRRGSLGRRPQPWNSCRIMLRIGRRPEQWRGFALRYALNPCRLRNRGVTLAMRRTR